MKASALWILAVTLGATGQGLAAAPAPAKPAKPAEAGEERDPPRHLKDESQRTSQSVTVGGRTLAYQTEAGVLVVRVKDPLDEEPAPPVAERTAPPPMAPEASMSYAA